MDKNPAATFAMLYIAPLLLFVGCTQANTPDVPDPPKTYLYIGVQGQKNGAKRVELPEAVGRLAISDELHALDWGNPIGRGEATMVWEVPNLKLSVTVVKALDSASFQMDVTGIEGNPGAEIFSASSHQIESLDRVIDLLTSLNVDLKEFVEQIESSSDFEVAKKWPWPAKK